MNKFVVAAAFAAVLSGCASTQPVGGLIYSDVSGPVAATGNPRGPNHGEACATSYLGLVALGDASISKAEKAGGVSTLSYVEQHSNSILGIITTYCTQVWGYPAKNASPAPASVR